MYRKISCFQIFKRVTIHKKKYLLAQTQISKRQRPNIYMYQEHIHCIWFFHSSVYIDIDCQYLFLRLFDIVRRPPVKDSLTDIREPVKVTLTRYKTLVGAKTLMTLQMHYDKYDSFKSKPHTTVFKASVGLK